MTMTKPTPVVNPERVGTVSTGHPHGIHCCHIKGNDHNRWCVPCRSMFDRFIAATFEEDGVSLHQAYAKFQSFADLHLVGTVLGQIESTVLPLPDYYQGLFPQFCDWNTTADEPDPVTVGYDDSAEANHADVPHLALSA